MFGLSGSLALDSYTRLWVRGIQGSSRCPSDKGEKTKTISKSCIIAIVTDLESLIQFRDSRLSESHITPGSHCNRGDRRETHQLPVLTANIGNLPMNANAIDPHWDVLGFQTSLSDSESPLEKGKVILLIWRNTRSKLSKQFPLTFHFHGFYLVCTPFLENHTTITHHSELCRTRC